MKKLDRIILKIIKDQELIIGPIAWKEAFKIKGLKILDIKNKSIYIQDGQNYQIIKRIVSQYEKSFGKAAREVCYKSLSEFNINTEFLDFGNSSLTKNKVAEELYKQNVNTVEIISKLKENDQLKSEFLSLATHQISTPLTVIKGYISLIQERNYGEIPKDLLNVIDIIQQSTNKTINVVRDSLDLSLIHHDEGKYNFKNFNIKELIEKIIYFYKPLLENKNLKVLYNCEPKKDFVIYADEGSIKQALCNIINYSLKYINQGYIKIELLSNNSNKIIKISDSAIRNLPVVPPKFIQKFLDSKNVNESIILGNSFSLYITRQIIKANNGDFEIKLLKQNFIQFKIQF